MSGWIARFILFGHLALQFGRVTAWDYSAHGRNWNRLGQCAAGTGQSPIDLPVLAEEELKNIMYLKYPKLGSGAKLYNNGHSIALTLPADFRAGFGITSEGPDHLKKEDALAYRLWQVTFHAPSEHTIGGQRMPLEIELAHQRVTGPRELAVVSVLFTDAADVYNDFLEAALGSGLPTESWSEIMTQRELDFSSLMGGSTYYNYEGSATEPPCESQVQRYIRKDPVSAAHKQLLEFQKVLKAISRPSGNYRGLQQAPGSPPTWFSTVDLVRNPKVKVQPRWSDLPKKGDRLPEKDASKTGCDSPTFWTDIVKNIYYVRANDSPETALAKTRFVTAEKNFQQAEKDVSLKKSSVQLVKSQFENAAGPVDQIHLKWDLINAENMHNEAIRKSSHQEQAYKVAFGEAKQYFTKLCLDHVAKERGKPRAGPEAWKGLYEGATVELPHGLDASPFVASTSQAKREKRGEGAGSASSVLQGKLAGNLREYDRPPGGGNVKAATPKKVTMKSGGSRSAKLRLRLPIAPGNITDPVAFRNELKEALAKTGQVSPKQIHMEGEMGEALVHKVRGSRDN